MTRPIRSRRAGRSREEARQQPLYARMLGLRHLAPSGFLCFVFLEGAVALGVLLALAELVSWWGIIVLPVTVAAMVKLNDVIAGAVAAGATADRRAGVSASSPAGPGRVGVASPDPRRYGSAETQTGLLPEVPAAREAGDVHPAATPALRAAAAPVQTTADQVLAEQPYGFGDDPAPRRARTVDLQKRAQPVRTSAPAVTAIDASPLNGPPPIRHWDDHVDPRAQRARQSAARRYE